MATPTAGGKLRMSGFRRRILLTGCTIIAACLTTTASAASDNNSLSFFTTIADKLLRNTFNFGVTNIPVYTNGTFVYKPSVQRLLQLSANIYDATTNRTGDLGRNYPSVFRPLFSVTSAGEVYISGYTNVASVTNADDPVLSAPLDPSALAAEGPCTNFPVNVYGVPWIIGAKKGFPAFNQFYMLNGVEVTRKLLVSKPYFGATLDMFITNQMYVFSISNSLGCSFWNSYTNDYTNANLTIVANDHLTMVLTNDSGGILAAFHNVPYQMSLQTNFWPGTSWASVPPYLSLTSTGCFVQPMNTTAVLLPNSIYRYAGYSPSYPGGVPMASPGFDSHNFDYQTNVLTPALPQFGLATTNRLQAFILDGNHVIDYVQFPGPENSRNLNTELADPAISNGSSVYLWSTNPFSASDPSGTPWGVVNQIVVSQGYANPANNISKFWQAPPNLPAYLPPTPAAEQVFFNGFFNVNQTHYGLYAYNAKLYTNTALAVQAPYTPTRMLYDCELWQANDPLVHFLASDLNVSLPGTTGVNRSDDPSHFLPTINLCALSRDWSSWGVASYWQAASPTLYLDTTFLTSVKDSLVWRPDDWNFPTGQDWSLSALGRVHRGTPWQTLYLKSTDILAAGSQGINTWTKWTGDPDANDAQLMAPKSDWQLLGLILPLLNTNNPTQLLSLNDPNLSHWLTALDGLIVTTNSGPDRFGYTASPQLDDLVMSSNSPQALLIANAIAQERAAQPGNNFLSLGDMLPVSALTENSPWLNAGDPIQVDYAIPDEAYEAIPSQLLPRLRPDSFGSLFRTNGNWNVRFTGADGYVYVLQTSTDLLNWDTISTNWPDEGGFSTQIFPTGISTKRYYRSVLLP